MTPLRLLFLLSLIYHLLLIIGCVGWWNRWSAGERQKHTHAHTRTSHEPHARQILLKLSCLEIFVHVCTLVLVCLSNTTSRRLSTVPVQVCIRCGDLEQPGIPQCISIWPSAAAVVELLLYSSVYKGGKAPAVRRSRGRGLKRAHI